MILFHNFKKKKQTNNHQTYQQPKPQKNPVHSVVVKQCTEKSIHLVLDVFQFTLEFSVSLVMVLQEFEGKAELPFHA